MAAVSIVARKDRTGPNGWAPLRIRIAHQGTKRFIPLGFKVLASKWNSGRQRVTRSHPEQDEYNEELSDIESAAHAALREENRANHVVTARRVKKAIQKRLEPAPEAGHDFLEFAKKKLDEYRRREQFSTFESYQSVLRKFADFLELEYGIEEIPFDMLDLELFRSFRTYCYEVRDNSPNTVGSSLQVVRTFVRKAMKEGKIRRDPTEGMKIDSEPVQHELLRPGEIERMADLELDDDSHLAEVRRWFLFAYYTGGMRFSDVATLQWKHIRPGPSGRRRVYYKMEKTSDSVGVPLTENARQILSRYDEGEPSDWVFPIMKGIDPANARAVYNRKRQRNSDANEALQELGEKAGIEKHVRFHLSRNAAAWKLYQEVDDIYKVRDFLGHSSVEQTEAYIDGFEDESRDEDFLDAMG